MKKAFIPCFAALTIALAGCSQTSSSSDFDRERMSQETDLSMPEAFEHNGGDENNNFYLPCEPKFDSVNSFFSDLVNDNEAIEQWVNEMNENQTPCDLEDYINIYSFMVRFDIPAEDICDAMEESNSFYLNWYGEEHPVLETIYFTDEELEAFETGDKATITAQFASEYSIVIDDKIFSPNWVYYHTAEDYADCGITAEMLEEKSELYENIKFSEEARAALEDKISAYSQADASE